MAQPLKKPLVVFDGDCNFCRFWIARYKNYTGDRVDNSPYQQLGERFPEIPLKNFQRAVHLITPEGKVYTSAEAVFRILAYAPEKRIPLWLYENVPGFKQASEYFYRLVARHRSIFSFFTRLIWGRHIQPETYFLIRWIFIRVLGAIFLIAFVSLWVQVLGLVGSDGILPVEPFLKAVRDNYGEVAPRLLPSVFWFKATDSTLLFACGLGSFLSILVMFGVAPAPLLFILWALYLSFISICREFLSFQWDVLLLETSLLAIFFSPLQIKPDQSRESPPSKLAMILLKWLLFRLMFMSGMVKLLSGDPTWRSLKALTVHYATQPLPTWTSWIMHQLPSWFQTGSCALMFFVELILPFFFFAPRRIRYTAGLATIGFQVLILATGNYCFFNLLAIALCLLLFDDSIFPERWRKKWEARRSWSPEFPSRHWPKWILVPFAAIALFMTGIQLSARWGARLSLPAPATQAAGFLFRLNSFNSYGLFAVMTTERLEIVLEGSNDGKIWLPYEFKYKPGNTTRRPGFVEPHQPRLDWQMWFAALGNYKQNPWLISLMQRLMEGSSPVLKLLDQNPFPNRPPQYIRAVLYEYTFTDFKTRKETGRWWNRNFKGLYCPPLSLHSK